MTDWKDTSLHKMHALEVHLRENTAKSGVELELATDLERHAYVLWRVDEQRRYVEQLERSLALSERIAVALERLADRP